MTLEYSNDEELEKIWMDKFQVFMDDARKSENVDEEYSIQQDVYAKFASAYDDATRLEKWSGPQRIAARINEMFPDNKSIKILDYGCGTGQVADHLHAAGFQNIDGLDPNDELVKQAKAKGIMKDYFKLRSDESHACFETGTYDVITSAGTFFLSASHPGFECVEMLCRLIRKGGYLVLLVKDAYLDCSFVNHDIVDELVKKGVVKKFPKELFNGYRQAFAYEADPNSTGAILIFQVL